MATDLTKLLDLLDIETIDTDLYRGPSSIGKRSRVYGGQVLGQALVAANRTVEEERPVHSLHAYFMRPGDPTIPIIYDVDRLRDGRSFTTRRVRASQRGKAIFTLEASFHVVEEDGLFHQPTAPQAPDPEGLESYRPPGSDDPTGEWGELAALEFRGVRTDPPTVEHDVPTLFWFKPNGQLGPEVWAHAAIMAYASDLMLLANVLRRHDMWFRADGLMVASLDHAMWFHTVPRADDWMLYEVTSPAAGGSRGLGLGRIYDRHGRLLCSVAQEGLARLID